MGALRLLIAMVLLAFPMVIAAFSWTKDNKVDRLLGELSYPLYVVHYGFVSALIHTNIELPYGISSYWATIIISSLCAVILVFCVQAPVDRWRTKRFSEK